ncbi:MAG: M50 family metallopeptidase [bacterium]|nr:M50 family metallopeptidase [bacterium]
MTIIIFLLILSLVVLIHELGHFLLAKKFGVWVKEFGIGFPPRLSKLFTWQDTDFTLNWIPLGGFCAMDGELEDLAAVEEEQKPSAKAEKSTLPTQALKKITPAAKAKKFDYKKPWQKFFIIAAGPLMNLLLGAVIFMIVFSVEGIPEKQKEAVYIEEVANEQTQLQAQTRILTLESSSSGIIQATSNQTVIDFVQTHRGELVEITTSGSCTTSGECNDELLKAQVYVRTAEETPPGEGALGITLSEYRVIFYPWYKQIPLSVVAGFAESWRSAKDLLIGLGQALGDLIIGKESEVVMMGPVGIVSQLNRQQTFRHGWLVILQFIGILSINVGVMNLLPIPALDGGRIILIFLEKFFGREKIAKFEIGLNYFGFIFLIVLTILVTGQDIWRVFQGG